MELISLTTNNFQSVVESTAEAIQKGAVVIAPTDTVYGLLANAKNAGAVKRLYSIKRRDSAKPLPIFVKHLAMAKSFAVIGAKDRDFLDRAWPGQITAVLRRKKESKIFGAGRETIALRIPDYRFINSLLEVLNLPLAQTSANISGLPASGKIDEVIGQFMGLPLAPDIAVNAGDLQKSKPSTIIDLTQKNRLIIRP